MGPSEWHRVIERAELLKNRLRDFWAAVPCGNAKQSRRGVNDFIAIGLVEIHAFTANKHPGLGFEFFVRGKRHPKVLPSVYIDHWIRVAHNLLPC